MEGFDLEPDLSGTQCGNCGAMYCPSLSEAAHTHSFCCVSCESLFFLTQTEYQNECVLTENAVDMDLAS